MVKEVKEKWKTVPNYNGRYWVSTNGEIRNNKGKIMAIRPNHHGYMTVQLNMNGKSKVKPVHRIVLETFVGPCPEGMQTRHLKNDKTNNRLDNLKWGTSKEQIQDRRRHGTMQNKLKEKDVRAFLLYCKKFMAKHDVPIWTLSGIVKQKSWSHIYDEVFMPNSNSESKKYGSANKFYQHNL